MTKQQEFRKQTEEGKYKAFSLMCKKVAELEQKLEQAEKDLTDYQFNYPSIKELEKENAELKAENEANKNGAEKYAEFYFKTNEQLVQAKELLEQTLSYLDNIDEEGDELYDKINAFIKE